MTRTAIVLAGLILAVGAMPLLADDVNIPPWRGQPRTTFQQWEFDTPNLKPPPDLWSSNPTLTPPTLTVTPDPYHPDWIPSYPPPGELVLPRPGVWALSGSIVVDLPNYHDGEWKELWLQLVWMPMEDYPLATPSIQVQGVPPDQVVLGGLVSSACAGTPWTYSWYKYTLIPNPDLERVTILGNIYVDELVIDTYCPEPATMALLGLGGLGMLFRRKR